MLEFLGRVRGTGGGDDARQPVDGMGEGDVVDLGTRQSPEDNRPWNARDHHILC